MAGLVPSLLLALFSAWCGTFAWGASSPAAVAAALALLGVLFWTGVPWRDPLRLGASGRLLPAALWVAVAASCWASPVPRAGWVAVLLLPAFYGVPAVVERCWRREADRRLGLRALALTVAGVSLWALLDWMVLGSPRAAMPLGHHNLLAAWLVILLPLAALPAREPGWWRLSGVAAVGLAVLAILASRSLLGFAALGVEILAALGGRSPAHQKTRQKRGWAVLLVLALLVSFLQFPRILRIVSGDDPSSQARGAYWAAAVDGLRANPLLGWGPGSAAWTAAAFLDPVPRVNPWGESVGELHSLPLQVGYELGFTGLALALGIVVLFFARRVGDREEGRAPALLSAGLLGLGGGALASLGSGALAVTALPLAAAVAAGAALAGSGRGKHRLNSPVGSALPTRIYALAALLALTPLLLAQWRYDRAVTADTSQVPGQGKLAEAELEAAMRLDPSFPLYPMRLALLQARDPGRQAAASELSLRAAWKGMAVPQLWLVAGIQGQAARRPWASFTLERACVLDPLNPFAPFYQMLAAPDPVHGAQALMAEPRLLAALFWERRPDLRRRALESVRSWPGVDAGWKEALLAVPPSAPGGPVSRVSLLIDAEDRESLSLPVFRRRPWPAQWGLIEVRESALEKVRRLPPAAASKGTSPGFLRKAPCLSRSARGQSLLNL